jgi:uncharacterized YigZ family protein
MNTTQDDEYLTVSAQTVSSELKIKGSRFIASIYHAITKEQAESHYSTVRRKYHDATHNCYAYRISDDQYRFSDDGEPTGTAGKPILKVIETNNLIQTLIVVTRYFGGTKLGTGGLSRAYSDAAKDVINKTSIEVKTRYITLTVETGYDYLSKLLDLVNKFSGIMGKTEYAEKIVLCMQIPTSKIEKFKEEFNAFSEHKIISIDDE